MRRSSTLFVGNVRGRPYLAQGTILDYTASPQHQSLPDLQMTLDQSAGRAPTGLFNGPVVMSEKGIKPLFSGRAHEERTQQQRMQRLTRQQPSFYAQEMTHYNAKSIVPPLNDGYQPDMRIDSAFDDLSPVERAARQSILDNQSDSYGEAQRMMVPPPPRIPDDAPRAYVPPKVQLDNFWWPLMWSFVLLFFLLAKLGR